MKLNKKRFYKIVFLSAVFNIGWALISPFAESLMKDEYGPITIFGFLTIYGLTFFLEFPSHKQNAVNFIILILSLIGIFIASTFIIAPSMGFEGYGILISPIFSAVLITLLVNCFVKIHHKAFIIILFSIVTLGINALLFFTERKVITGSFAAFFSIWQIVTTAIIPLGISLEKIQREPANSIES